MFMFSVFVHNIENIIFQLNGWFCFISHSIEFRFGIIYSNLYSNFRKYFEYAMSVCEFFSP